MYKLRNLRRLRDLKGWSGRELARASGVSRNTISELERLLRTARSDTVDCLARALEVHLDKLTGRPLPEVKEIECPQFAQLCIDGADYLDTIRTYEMGECVVLVRENRSGWVVTLFHPTRFPKWIEQEDAWDSLVGPWIPWAAGLSLPPRPWPEEAPELPGRWGETGNEPFRWTLVQPHPILRNEYEASRGEVDGDTRVRLDELGLHISSPKNATNTEYDMEEVETIIPPPIYFYTWQQERVPFFFPDWVREKFPMHVFVWDEIVYVGNGSLQTLRLTIG